MNMRRKSIKILCRLVITRENVMIEEYTESYKHLLESLKPLLPTTDHLAAINVEEFVESVGDCIFNDRPANIAYIMAFLEFVHQIFEESNTLSPDIIIDSAVNVIERASFNPIQDNSKLFRFIVDIFVNIIALIIINLF